MWPKVCGLRVLFQIFEKMKQNKTIEKNQISDTREIERKFQLSHLLEIDRFETEDMTHIQIHVIYTQH